MGVARAGSGKHGNRHPRSGLLLGAGVLGALSLLIVGLNLSRTRRLVATDHVLVAPTAAVSTRVRPEGAREPAVPAVVSELATSARMRSVEHAATLALLRAELDTFARTAWPERVPGCRNFGEAHWGRMSANLAVGTNETFHNARTQPRWISPERLAATADGEGIVIVTWANAHFSDFVENFVASLQRLGLENYLVGALDDELVGLLTRGGRVPPAHVFRMLADEALEMGAKEHWGWGSAKFNQMGRHKGVLMRSALAMGVTLLLCDVDTVWLRDPRPLFRKYPQVDLLISTDVLSPSRTRPERDAPFASADGGLESAVSDIGHAPHSQLLLMRSNIGVMLLRPTLAMRLFIEEYMRVLAGAPAGTWDQAVFNDVLRSGFALSSRRMSANEGTSKRVGHQLWEVPQDLEGVQVPAELPDRSVKLYCGLLRVGILPTASFANGWAFWVGRLHETLGLQPYVVHNTYQYFGSSGKRMRFREAGLWFVDPQGRFSMEGGGAGGGLAKPWAATDLAVAGEYALGKGDGGGLLRAAVYVPPSLLEQLDISALTHAASKLPQHHAALLQAQLSGAASVLALARALRRAVELPSLWCGCDRTFMVAWNCSYWPALLKRPFRCPADHAFDLAAWDGMRLPYREAGFWDRSPLPEQPGAAPSASALAVAAGEAKSRSGGSCGHAGEGSCAEAAGVRVHLCGARPSGAPPASASLAALAASASGEGALAGALRARCAQAEAAAATAAAHDSPQQSSSLARAFRTANEEGAARARSHAHTPTSPEDAPAEAARAALLPRGLSDEEAAEALAPFAWAPALALDSTDGLLGRIANEHNRQTWATRFAPALGMQWCCTPAGGFKFNFSAAADCSSEERIGLLQRGRMDRILHCEGGGGFDDVHYPII